jgi:hypothetical protein
VADNGLIGNGTKVGYRISGSPSAAYTTIGQILEIAPMELKRDGVDRTVHSANDFMRELPGMIKVSPMKLTLLANPDELQGQGIIQDALLDLLIAGTTVEWRYEVPTNRLKTAYKGYVFDGFVMTWTQGAPIKDRQTYNFEIAFDDSSFDPQSAGVSVLA